MLRFSQFISEEILVENRIEFLKTQNPTLDTSHDTLAKHKDAGKIIDHFATKADPTPTKAHTQWIVNQYKKKTIRQEDAPQIKNTLNDFTKVKDHLEKKDLNQYADIAELRDAIATQKPQVEKIAKSKKISAENKSADMIKLYDKDGVTGYKIPNKEVSIKNYGPGGKIKETNWCTAANSSQNQFNTYKGGKYTMHFPNGEVLQFHHQSDQIMDKYDSQIHEGNPNFKDYETHISNFINQTRKDENNSSIKRFIHYEPHEIHDAIDKYKESIEDSRKYYTDTTLKDNLEHVITHAKLSDDHFKKISKLPIVKIAYDNNKPTGMPTKLSNNKRLTHEQINILLTHPDDDVKIAHEKNLVMNPSVSGTHIDHLLNSERLQKHHRSELCKNPNLESRHIDKLIDEDKYNHHMLASNKSIRLSKEHQQKILDNRNPSIDVTHTLTSRDDLHPDIAHEILNGKFDAGSKYQAIKNISHDENTLKDYHSKLADEVGHEVFFKHSNTSPEFKTHILDQHINNLKNRSDSNSYDSDLQNMLQSKYFTKEHLDKVLNAGDEEHEKKLTKPNIFRRIASKYLKASPAQLERQVNTIKPGNNDISYELSKNKNLKPEHLKKILDAEPTTESITKDNIMNHPATNGDVLHHVMDKGSNFDRLKVLHHDKVQLSHFQKAVDFGPKLHGAITSAPSAPPSILHKMADSPYSFVRENVVNHKNTSKETLSKLSNDEDESIAAIANKRLKK